MACSASASVETPELLEYGVRPTPTIAARSRSAALTIGCSREVDPRRLELRVLEDALPAGVASVAAVFPTAEGERPVDTAVGVHPHRSALQVADHAVRALHVRRPHTG